MRRRWPAPWDASRLPRTSSLSVGPRRPYPPSSTWASNVTDVADAAGVTASAAAEAAADTAVVAAAGAGAAAAAGAAADKGG